MGALLLMAFHVDAQAVDTSTAEGLIHYILQHVDKTQVPTHFLEEYGAPVIPMETFDGVLTDSNRIDMDLWRTLYFQLYTGYVGPGAVPIDSITAVNQAIRQSMADTLPIPIPLLIGQYNSVKSNAFSSNLLSYDSSQHQVYDVAGRPQSPYQLNHLFAACPNTSSTSTGAATFVCKPGLIWNNTGKSISSIQVDFADGQGFQTLALNTPVSVSYADTGTVRWKIKVTLSDNSVLQCYSEYHVLQASSSGSRYSGSSYNDYWYVPPTADYAGADVYISYTSKDRTNTMRKPLIVVEGYDVSAVAPDIQSNYSYFDFITAINEPSALYDFNGHLDDIAGYDLVFIDFRNGTDDIKRNAKLVEHIIGMVNTAKASAGSSKQDVVMGLSMGGLVARYALAEMTKNNDDPETRLLITHDSPHRGANVPLGVQYLIEMAGHVHLFGYDVHDIYPQYDEAISLLNEPATQQLLLYRATGPATFANNTFLDGDYRSMVTFDASDPQPAYRFIATSLGSQCGHPIFSPHQRLFYSNSNAFLFLFPLLSYKLVADIGVYALPNTGSTDEIARISVSSKFKLFGFITISKQVYSNTAYAPGTQLPVDGAPGSTNPLIDIDAPHANFGFLIPPILGIWGAVNVHVNGDPTTFCFVPTVSALDVSPFNSTAFSAPFIDGYNADFPSKSATYIAQEAFTEGSQTAYNNAHIRFTARNAQWLYDEMENISNSLNCSSECSPDNNFTINGANSFCTSATYNVPGIPYNAIVTWSASPSGIVSLSPNGNSVTVTVNGGGNVTLTAAVTDACTGFSIHKTVAVGTPPIHGSYTVNGVTYGLAEDNGIFEPYNPVCFTGNPTLLHTSMDIEGASSVSWSRLYPTGIGGLLWGQVGDSLSVTFRSPTEEGIFQVSATNTCGTNAVLYSFKAHFCSQPLIIAPNPAANMVTISLPATENTSKSKGMQANAGLQETTSGYYIREVSIYDANGSLKMQQQFNEGSRQVQMDISALPPGIYVVQVSNGHATVQQKLVIH